jgi:peptide/nickel transport system substrate-binding protein
MTESKGTTLAGIVDELRQGRLSRRGFIAAATKTGLSASMAAGIFAAVGAGASAAGGGRGRVADVSFQDGGKTLVVSIAQATVQLDPAIAGSNGYGDIIPINENIYEGLTRFKLGGADIEPALAESWTASDDGLTYVFKIRPNVTFHDGTPLDAKAVETNFLRQFDPNNPLHQDGMVYTEIIFAEVKSIQATGDLDLTITLNRPITLLPGNLAVFAAAIPSPTALEQFKDDYSNHASGTGPFKLESWTKDVELVLVANDQYWGGRPKLDRVVFRTIADDTVRLTELQTGGVDVANQIDFKDVETVRNDQNLTLVTGPFLNVQYLAFNEKLAPFDNPKVRQAFEYAINKQNIADVVFFGNYTLGAGPIAPGLIGYDESLASTYSFDPEKAKALLAESGVGQVSFDFYNRTNSFWPLLGQLIQADLEAVGVKANLVSLEDAEFFAQLNASKAPAFMNDWTWDNGDPDNVMWSLFSAPRAESRLGYKNDRVNELNTQAQLESDPAKRAELYLEAQQLILQDAINVILGYPSRAIGTSNKVQNLVLSPVGNIVLRDVDLA